MLRHHSTWLARLLRPLLLLHQWIADRLIILRYCLSNLRLNIWHLIHHVSLRSNIVSSSHLLSLKHVNVWNLVDSWKSLIRHGSSTLHHRRLSKLRRSYCCCSSPCSHQPRVNMLLRNILSLTRHPHHSSCSHRIHGTHTWHSSRLELKDRLSSNSSHMLIVLINKCLNLHERCLSQSQSSIWINLCNFIKIVFSHVFISVFDEYISRNFSL